MIINVFVGSTWLDLQPERQAVEMALQRMRETKFIGMEYFGSRDETTQRASLDEVDRSQVYVGIVGGRYGSGITEDEYRRAWELKLPCFIYAKEEKTIPAEWWEKDAANSARLSSLTKDLHGAHTVTPFSNPDELAAKVTADLHRWLFEHYLPPRLERFANGEIGGTEAQTLVNGIKDWDALPSELVNRLGGVRQAISSGSRSVAIGGNVKDSTIITGNVHQQGDGNVIGLRNTVTVNKNMTHSATLNDLVALLGQLRTQVQTLGLPADDHESIAATLTTLEKEIAKEKPRLAIVDSSLKSVESMVQSTETIGTTAAKLLPMIYQAVEFARQLFS